MNRAVSILSNALRRKTFTSCRCISALASHNPVWKRGDVSQFSVTPKIRQHVFIRHMAIITSPYKNVDLPNEPLPDFLLNKFKKYGDEVALVDGTGSTTYTFNDITKYSRAVSSGLARAGFKKGDVTCIFMANCPEYLVAFLGVTSIGGICTTANPAYTANELSHQMVDSKTEYIITQSNLVHTAQTAAEMANANIKGLYVLGDEIPEGCKPFSELLNDDGTAYPDNVTLDINDVVVLPYSSGTTGLPKGVMLTHHNITSNMVQSTVESLLDLKPTDHVLAVLPFFHIYGLVPVLMSSLIQGAKVVTMKQFTPERYLELIVEHQLNILYIVPPIILFMAKHPMVDNYNLSCIDEVLCGAAPLSSEMEEQILHRLSIPIIRQGFGMTETSPVITIEPKTGTKPGTCGVLIPNIEAMIMDDVTGTSVGPNKRGELLVRGPQNMKGYLNNEEATKQTLREDGFLKTGDIAYYDDTGYFYIVDRKKELIKYKGFQVAPAELEALILTHPAVADVAVIPIPDERAGEIPRAYVTLKPYEEADSETILTFVKGQVADHKRLRGGVYIVKEIPKSPSGKILRRILKEEALKQKEQ